MIPQRNQIGTVFFPPANDFWSHFWLLLSSVTGSFARSKKANIWKTWSLRLNLTPGAAAAASSSLKVSWVVSKWILLQWVVAWNGFGAMKFCCKWVVLLAMDFIAKWVVVVVSLQKCMCVFGIWELNEWWVWLLRVCRVCSDGVKEWFRRVVGFCKRPKERKKHPRTDWLTFRLQRVLLLLRQQKKRSGLGICLMVADGNPLFCLCFCRFFFGFVEERR
jgi:hypothetical protein